MPSRPPPLPGEAFAVEYPHRAVSVGPYDFTFRNCTPHTVMVVLKNGDASAMFFVSRDGGTVKTADLYPSVQQTMSLFMTMEVYGPDFGNPLVRLDEIEINAFFVLQDKSPEVDYKLAVSFQQATELASVIPTPLMIERARHIWWEKVKDGGYMVEYELQARTNSNPFVCVMLGSCCEYPNGFMRESQLRKVWPHIYPQGRDSH